MGRDYANHNDYAAETAKRIDDEVERIMREAHLRALRVLDARRDQMAIMARVLLDRETVEGEVVDALLGDRWAEFVEEHPTERVDLNHDGFDDSIVVPEDDKVTAGLAAAERARAARRTAREREGGLLKGKITGES